MNSDNDVSQKSGSTHRMIDSTDTLTLSARVALEALAKHQPASAQTIADESVLTYSTTRKALSNLHGHGLVDRRPDPQDARVILYEICDNITDL